MILEIFKAANCLAQILVVDRVYWIGLLIYNGDCPKRNICDGQRP